MNVRLLAVQFVGGPWDGVVLAGFPTELQVPAGDEIVHRGCAPGAEPLGPWAAAYHLKCEIASGQSAHCFRYDFAGYEPPGRRNGEVPWRDRLGGWLGAAAGRLAQWMTQPIDFPFDYYRAQK
jgi:hypothetical protein